MTMRHAACRRALLDGDLDPEVAEHLDQCERCRAYSRDLGLVSEYAALLDPGPAPAGLATRVVDHVRTAGTAGTANTSGTAGTAGTSGGAPEAPSPGPPIVELDTRRAGVPSLSPGRRGPLLASLSIAAVMMLLVGVLATFQNGRPADRTAAAPALDPLLTAAERTAAARSARLHLTGTATMRVTVPSDVRPALPKIEFSRQPQEPAFEPPPLPSLDQVPAELRAEMRRQYDEQVARARQEYERFAGAMRQRLQALESDTTGTLSRIEVPHEFSFEAGISGEGEVAFPDRLRLRGSVNIVDARPALSSQTPGDYEVVVVGPNAFYRGPEGAWLRIPGPSGPLGPLVLDPGGIRRLLTGSQPGTDDLGRERLDGEWVHHYRFQVAASTFGADGSTAATADAWIGADHVLRKLTTASVGRHHSSDGFSSELTTRMTLRLDHFGADVSIEAPEARGQASSPFGPAAVLYPFADGFGVSFYYGIEGPAPPAPPDIELKLPEFTIKVPEVPSIPDLSVTPPTPPAPQSAPEVPTGEQTPSSEPGGSTSG